jgi:DNA-binding IclR family transcriptional regulator
MEQDGSSGTQAVERLLHVIEAVGRSGNGVDAATIASELGLSPSTVYRLLGVLQRGGYVMRDSHRYVLGRTVAALGLALHRQVIATPRVRQLLERTRDQVRAPIYLTAFRAGEIIVAHIAESRAHPRIAQLHVGFADSSHATAFGKLMLAASSDEAVERQFAEHTPLALTRRSITGSGALRAELEQVRRDGIAIEVEEYMSRLACIAAPIRSAGGRVIGAVSASTTADDFRSRAESIELALRRTAWTVSSELSVASA